MHGAELAQHLGQRLQPARVEHAQHLPACAGGIGQGAQQVEDGPETEVPAHRQHVLHGRMMRRREQEADPRLVQGAARLREAGVDVHTQSSQHVG